MDSSNKEIYDRLNKVLKELFQIDIEKVGDEFFNENLLSYKLGFKARHLVYLLIGIENEFGITIRSEDIAGGKFSNIVEIIRIIERELQAKQDVKYA